MKISSTDLTTGETTVRDYTPEEVDDMEARQADMRIEFMARIRAERNRRLAETDALVTPPPDRPPVSPEYLQALLAYRQTLRDLPQIVADPLAFDWADYPMPKG